MKKDKKLLKQFEPLLSDEQAEREVDEIDLSEYDLSEFKKVRLEDLAKEARIMLRLPQPLLDAVKAEAARRNLPYSRFIRLTLEDALRGA